MKKDRIVDQIPVRLAILAGMSLPLALAWEIHATGLDLVDLGTLGGVSSQPVAINNLNTVVGTYKTMEGAERAFRWTPLGGARDLGTLGGASARPCHLSDDGHVLGCSETDQGELHAFLWAPGRGMIDLGPTPGAVCVARAISTAENAVGRAGENGHATQRVVWSVDGRFRELAGLGQEPTIPMDVNGMGVVVGTSYTMDGSIHAFRRTPDGRMEDLTMKAVRSYATRVNESGQVIGRYLTEENNDHAFLWTEKRGLLDLGTLGGRASCPQALSEDGRVAGWADNANGAGRAFLFVAEEGLVDLGHLGGGISSAKALNETGQVVGWAALESGDRHAFLWTVSDGMRDLGTLGGPRSDAVAINDQGTILGSSTTTNGQTHACVWVPRVEIPSETLAQGQ